MSAPLVDRLTLIRELLAMTTERLEGGLDGTHVEELLGHVHSLLDREIGRLHAKADRREQREREAAKERANVVEFRTTGGTP